MAIAFCGSLQLYARYIPSFFYAYVLVRMTRLATTNSCQPSVDIGSVRRGLTPTLEGGALIRGLATYPGGEP